MEENNINDVDLAQSKEFEEKEEQEQIENNSKIDEIILQQTLEIRLGEKFSIMNTLDLVGMGDDQAKLMLGDMVIGIVQNGKIEYTKNAKTPEVQEVLKKLNEEIEIQKQQEKETGEREEEKEPETIHDDNENNIEKQDENKEESIEPANGEKDEIKRDSSWIEIRSDRETDECRTFMGMIKKEYPEYVKGTERLFFAPNPKDANDYNLYVMGKNGKITGEIPLQSTEGRNPMQEDVLQYGRDGENATTKKPIQMLRIGNSYTGPMVMIYNGTRTDTQIHIGVRSQGDNYQSHQISSSRSQNNIQDAKESVKKATSSTLDERTDGDAEGRYYQVLKNLEEQNVPEEFDPTKDENKISDIEVENFENLKVSFARALMEEYGVNKECAAYVTIEVLENGKGFNETLDEANQILDEEKQKEEKGTIPQGSADRSAGKYYTDRLNPKQEDLEEELGRGEPRSY